MRVTDPRAPDPARVPGLILTCGLLVTVLAIIIGNVVALWWLGFDIIGIGLLGLADLILLSTLVAAMGKVNHLAEALRRKHSYSIAEADYVDAPVAIQDTMRDIFKAARSLTKSRAHQSGMFGDIDIDHVLYSAAEQAVNAAKINASLRVLKANAGATDEATLRRACVALRKIGRQLEKVEAELTEAARGARDLSRKLAEAEQARAVARQQELAEERRHAAQAHSRASLEESTAQAGSKVNVDATEISDRVAAVSAGYDKARQVSAGVLHDPSHDEAEPAPSVVQTAWNALRAVAGWLTHI